MSLETPSKIRMLQRKLYLKAKEEPTYRFYQEIESQGLEKWLIGIRDELHAETYKPQPVRRVMIPKPGGSERPLGIPTIRDRVVQTAAKLVLEPIFEADLEPEAYGYRPKRSAHDAIKRVHKLLCEGYTDVVDADLSKYFDKIPHRELLQCVARRVVDRDVLRLVKMWLKAPVEERDEKGNRRMTGGRGSTCGTPQGGVASPMLANLYMNRFLKYWRITGRRERFQAHVVNYADDFVILSREHAVEDRKSTRLNSSHLVISYAVFCLKKKNKRRDISISELSIAASAPRVISIVEELYLSKPRSSVAPSSPATRHRGRTAEHSLTDRSTSTLAPHCLG